MERQTESNCCFIAWILQLIRLAQGLIATGIVTRVIVIQTQHSQLTVEMSPNTELIPFPCPPSISHSFMCLFSNICLKTMIFLLRERVILVTLGALSPGPRSTVASERAVRGTAALRPPSLADNHHRSLRPCVIELNKMKLSRGRRVMPGICSSFLMLSEGLPS